MTTDPTRAARLLIDHAYPGDTSPSRIQNRVENLTRPNVHSTDIETTYHQAVDHVLDTVANGDEQAGADLVLLMLRLRAARQTLRDHWRAKHRPGPDPDEPDPRLDELMNTPTILDDEPEPEPDPEPARPASHHGVYAILCNIAATLLGPCDLCHGTRWDHVDHCPCPCTRRPTPPTYILGLDPARTPPTDPPDGIERAGLRAQVLAAAISWRGCTLDLGQAGLNSARVDLAKAVDALNAYDETQARNRPVDPGLPTR